MSVDEIVRRMLEKDRSRGQALESYTAMRLYIAENKRFDKHAEITVQENYSRAAEKRLAIVSERGSEYVRRKVIRKVIEAELDSGRKPSRDQTRITPENYRFQLVGAEEMDGRRCFVVVVTPIEAKKYLLRGKIWVDQQDFAITRMEGSPAKNPSFWTRKVHIVRRYRKYGPFWLPASTESESEILIAGKSSLRIDYADYRINAPSEPARGTDRQDGMPD